MGQNVKKGVAGHFHMLHNSRWEVQTCWNLVDMHENKMNESLLNVFEFLVIARNLFANTKELILQNET